MLHQFSETAPGGTVSGRKAVSPQAGGLVYEYEIQSTATERVTVHLADRVPADVAEDVGFHREHEPAAWTLSDDELEMSVELSPGDERTVVLGIATDESDLADDQAATALDVDIDVDVGDGGDVGADDAVGAAPEDGRGARRGPRVDADGGLVDAPQGATGGVVSRLVDELEAGTVPASELDALREHLGTDQGDAAARVDAVADEVAAVRRRQDELADRIEDLAAAQAAHADTLEALEIAHEEDLAAVRSDLERRTEVVGDDLATLRRDLEADLAALEREVEAFESTRRALIDGFRGTVDDGGPQPGDADDAETEEAHDTESEDEDAETEDDDATVDATVAADQGAPEERDGDDPDDVFIPPSRLDEVSGDEEAGDGAATCNDSAGDES